MRAKKSLGQNFLVDANLQKRIVQALEAGPDDHVVEIGPGRGALTRHLLGRVAHLTLIELDDALAGALAGAYAGRDDVTVVHANALRVPLGEHVPDPTRALVIGNIPYNITTPLLFHLLERPRPRAIVVMVQTEVARRVVAKPGDRDYGALSVGVAAVAATRLLFHVPRTAFRPVPGVDSSVLRLAPFDPPPMSAADEARLRALTRLAFQWRRKQMQKILRDHPETSLSHERVGALASELGLDLTRRPETFAPDTLLALARRVLPEGPG